VLIVEFCYQVIWHICWILILNTCILCCTNLTDYFDVVFTCGIINPTEIPYPKPDGYKYKYKFLSMSICMGTNFYLTSNWSTWPCLCTQDSSSYKQVPVAKPNGDQPRAVKPNGIQGIFLICFKTWYSFEKNILNLAYI
jgi:hypothetical protein